MKRAQSDVDLLVVMPESWAGGRQREPAVAIFRALSNPPVRNDIVVTTPEGIACRGHVVGTVLRYALREGKVLRGSNQIDAE